MPSNVRLSSRLPQIAAELGGRVDAAVRMTAEAIEQGAKGRAPVDTGKLRNSIHTEHLENGYSVVAGDGEVFYGHLVEHGTTHSPAHPFLIPAAEQVRPMVPELVRKALSRL